MALESLEQGKRLWIIHPKTSLDVRADCQDTSVQVLLHLLGWYRGMYAEFIESGYLVRATE